MGVKDPNQQYIEKFHNLLQGFNEFQELLPMDNGGRLLKYLTDDLHILFVDYINMHGEDQKSSTKKALEAV
ncbi:MAG: hypothetical protein RPU35_02450 [Candidatus Sedimenticola sp. (ex Thyasira tokunagai)]